MPSGHRKNFYEIGILIRSEKQLTILPKMIRSNLNPLSL